MCDDVFERLLTDTVKWAKSGSFGAELASYPEKPERLLNAFLESKSPIVRSELLSLLLLSSEGRDVTAENLSSILGRELSIRPLFPPELERESELILISGVIRNNSKKEATNLKFFLSDGISADPIELISALGIDVAGDPDTLEKLSQLIGLYDPDLSAKFIYLATVSRSCGRGISIDRCVKGIRSILGKLGERWYPATRAVLLNALPDILRAPSSAKLETLQEINSYPLAFFTPEALNEIHTLVRSAQTHPEFRTTLCGSRELLSTAISLDSRLGPLLYSTCASSESVQIRYLLAACTILVVLWFVYRARLLPHVGGRDSGRSDRNSYQLTSLSESYRGERDELVRFFGISETASNDELNRSFRRMAKVFHPDSPTGSEAAYFELTSKYQRAKEIVVTFH
jgi:hypothetical protein